MVTNLSVEEHLKTYESRLDDGIKSIASSINDFIAAQNKLSATISESISAQTKIVATLSESMNTLLTKTAPNDDSVPVTDVNRSLAADIKTAITEAMNPQALHEAATAPIAEAVREAIMSLNIKAAIEDAARVHANDTKPGVDAILGQLPHATPHLSDTRAEDTDDDGGYTAEEDMSPNNGQRGNGGSARRHRKKKQKSAQVPVDDTLSSQASSRFKATKRSAKQWESTSYKLEHETKPSMDLVQLLFPVLRTVDPRDRDAPFDATRSTAAKVNNIPVLNTYPKATDVLRGPTDVAAKLADAQTAFVNNSIPMAYWGNFLASKMDGDYRELAESFLPYTPWHLCVFAIITAKGGIRPWSDLRQTMIASVTTPTDAMYVTAVERLTDAYRLAPILPSDPESALSHYISHLAGWGASLPKQISNVPSQQEESATPFDPASYVARLGDARDMVTKRYTKRTQDSKKYHDVPESVTHTPTTRLSSGGIDNQRPMEEAIFAVEDVAEYEVSDEELIDVDTVYITSFQQQTRRCYNCDKAGHYARNCKQPRRFRPRPPTGMVGRAVRAMAQDHSIPVTLTSAKVTGDLHMAQQQRRDDNRERRSQPRNKDKSVRRKRDKAFVAQDLQDFDQSGLLSSQDSDDASDQQ
ncbi:hypothetical protein SEPCBS119000_006734 [Sporothrix epigloea]|uniref:CCHC-type domain-containing protein n=1 Tax=Sporothrix epigloea TaxID=1892477 RepID=A0ABP0E5W9_9PEZI